MSLELDFFSSLLKQTSRRSTPCGDAPLVKMLSDFKRDEVKAEQNAADQQLFSEDKTPTCFCDETLSNYFFFHSDAPTPTPLDLSSSYLAPYLRSLDGIFISVSNCLYSPLFFSSSLFFSTCSRPFPISHTPPIYRSGS